jgi:BAI1-associated protein 3
LDILLQLCITINNIEQVRKALKQLPETLNFMDIEQAVEQGSELGTKTNLHATVREADHTMVEKIQQVVDRVADKVEGC